ncbi:unnamed protein product [Sympodiomycopsis kandeliae]
MSSVSLSAGPSHFEEIYHSRDLKPVNFNTFKPPREIKGGHRAGVRCLGWNADGRRLASAGVDKVVRIWTPERSLDVRSSIELKGHTETIEALQWDPTHPERVATTSIDKSVRLWDIRSATSVFKTSTPGANINLSFHPKGHLIAVGNREDVLSLIDVRAGGKILGTIKPSPPSSREEINEFSWNNSGSVFFATTGTGYVRIQDARSSNNVDAPKAVHESASANSTETEMQVDTDSTQDQDQAQDKDPHRINTTIQWNPIHTLVAHTATIFCTQVDPLGRYLATASADSTIGCWSIPEFHNVWMSGSDLSFPSRSLSLSYDGEYIAAGGEDSFIWIASTLNGALLHKLPVNGTINALCWNPTKHLLAYAGEEKSGSEGTIRVWGL